MVEHFKDLTKKEVAGIQKFAASPFLNSNKQVTKLITFLSALHPYLQEGLPDRKSIYNAVFDTEKIDEINYRKLISDFTRVFENFLIYNKLEKETVRNKIKLLNSLRLMGIRKRFMSNYKEAADIQKKIKIKDNTYYEDQIELLTEFYYFNYDKLRNVHSECLQDKSDNIDMEFVFHKLHMYLEMIFNEYMNNKSITYKKTFYNEVINYVRMNEKNIMKHHPGIYLIYNIVLLWKTSDDKFIKIFLDYLESQTKIFPIKKLKYYFYYILTYLSVKINAGEVKYREVNMQIFKRMLAKDIFLIDNIITHSDFNSVVNIALPAKEYDWLKKFMEKYKNNIEPEFQKDAYNLAMAKFYFHKKEFQKVYPFLNEVQYKDSGYYLNSKFLLARLYYEMRKDDPLEYVLQNLRQYLREKKNISGDYLSISKTFVKYITALLKITETDKKKAKQEIHILRKELDNEKKLVPNKIWFYEKTDELSKSL